MKLLKASLEIWWNWWTLNRHRKCLYLWCDDVVTHKVSIMHHCSHKMGSTIGLKLAQTTTTSRPYIALAAGCNPFVGRLVRASAILVRRTWSDSMVHVMFLKYLEYVSDIFQVIDLGQLWTWKGKQTELGRNTKKNQNSQPEWSLYSSISINEQNIESVDWYTWENFFQLTDAPNLILKHWIYLRWAESGNAVWEDSSLSLLCQCYSESFKVASHMRVLWPETITFSNRYKMQMGPPRSQSSIHKDAQNLSYLNWSLGHSIFSPFYRVRHRIYSYTSYTYSSSR